MSKVTTPAVFSCTTITARQNHPAHVRISDWWHAQRGCNMSSEYIPVQYQ